MAFCKREKKNIGKKFLSSVMFISLSFWSLTDCILVVLSPQAWVPVKRRPMVYKISVASSHHLLSQWFISCGPPSLFLSYSLWILVTHASAWHFCEISKAVHHLSGVAWSHVQVRSCCLVVFPPFPGRILMAAAHPCEGGLFSMCGWRNFCWCPWSSCCWDLNSKPQVLPSQHLF